MDADNGGDKDAEVLTPPQRGRGRGRGSTRRGRGRGRGGGSQAASPEFTDQSGSEEELSLREIPHDVGPAADSTASAASGAVGGVDDAAEGRTSKKKGRTSISHSKNISSDSEYDDEFLASEILRERRHQRRVAQEVELAELKEKTRALEKRKEKLDNCNRRSNQVFSRELPQPRRLREPRELEDVSGPGDLPSLHQYADQVPTLQDLRDNPPLQRRVDEQIAEQDLLVPDLPSEGAEGNQGAVASGRGAKVETGVLKQLIWPHTRLEGRVQNPSFDQLDLTNLVIGELGILEDPTTSRLEHQSRIRQLKRLLVYSRTFEWSLVRSFHGSFLSSVERAGHWGVDPNELAAQILFAAPRPQVVHQPIYQPQPQPPVQGPPPPPPYPGGPAQIAQVPAQVLGGYGAAPVQNRGRRRGNRAARPARFFCSEFNRGVCTHSGTHRAQIGGQSRWAEHFCAYCWLNFTDPAQHSEQDCPRKSGNQQGGGQE